MLPRSFVFSSAPIPGPDGARALPVRRGVLHLGEGIDAVEVGDDDGRCTVLLVGYAIDLRSPDLDTAAVARRLLAVVLSKGVSAALDETYHLLGRYCLVIRQGEAWSVAHDATGMRTVYYGRTGGDFVLASHSHLAAEVVGGRRYDDLLTLFRFGLPGYRSPYEGVRILPPNFVLDPMTGDLRRYWPRGPRRESAVLPAAAEFARLLDTAAAAIAARWQPVLSLTAGLDSRVTLSAFRSAEKTVFTYDRGSVDQVDLAVARHLCSVLGIPHTRLTTIGPKEAPETYETLSTVVDYSHIANVIPAYVRAFGKTPVMHVRSNLSEIGRDFWRSKVHPVAFSIERTMRMTMNPKVPDTEESRALRTDGYAEMFAILGYPVSAPVDHQILGYDVWDLLYWEHRMGTWHAPLLLGSDLAFDTAIIFNARAILDVMLSVPRAERRNATLLKDYVASTLPQAASIPFNPKTVEYRGAIMA